MLYVDLTLNVMVAILLGVTVWYCWRLNLRIRTLQDTRGELARLLKHFDESTRRASDSIAALQTASRKLGETVQGRIDKANLVADDLMFLVERAAKLSDELEAGLAARRAADAVLASGMRAAAGAAAPQAAPMAVKIPPKPAPAPAPAPAPKTVDPRAMLETLAMRGASDPALRGQRLNAAPERPISRSMAEQELLELIKAGR